MLGRRTKDLCFKVRLLFIIILNMEESNKHEYQEAKVIELPIKRQPIERDNFIEHLS